MSDNEKAEGMSKEKMQEYYRSMDFMSPGECQDVLEKFIDEIARLKGVVEKYPKTKDGVPIYPGMILYRSEVSYSLTVLTMSGSLAYGMVGNIETHWCCLYCYSKESLAVAAREVAEAAKKEKEDSDA